MVPARGNPYKEERYAPGEPKVWLAIEKEQTFKPDL